MKTNSDSPTMVEFGKLDAGNKFFLSNPIGLEDRASYIKMTSQKDKDGRWSNAKNPFGIVIFVQYDKRVWVK
jgi:hypothetical protein